MDTNWVSVSQLCGHLKLSKETVYNMVTENRLPHVKVGKSIRFDLLEVDEFLKKQKVILRKAGK
jgi:excisionase family DNA binding protein